MNFRVYVLAITAMAVGLVELLVGGILPVIAADLGVSIGSAGQLITVFALTYALSGPILYVATSKVERKRLFIMSLLVFAGANLLTYFSASFSFIMLARVVTAAVASLIVTLCITLAARFTDPAHRAKAIGFIYVGISSSLVFGIPLGVLVTDFFGWRVIFLFVTALALLALVLISLCIEKTSGQRPVPLREQLQSLKQPKLLNAQLAMVFMLAGHYTFYAYLAAYFESNLGLAPAWISLAYFAFGVAAVTGGLWGGILASKLGNQKAIVVILLSFAVSMLVLPLSGTTLWLFFPMMMLWGGISWALTPPLQSYLIESDPAHGDVQQSFNNSAIQIGISLGSAVGGVAIGFMGSIVYLAPLGGLIVLLALACAWYSFNTPLR